MRMKKEISEGFSLVELLAVIFIISIIGVIAFVTFNSVITNSKEKIDEQSISLILESTKDYVNEYRNTENWKEGHKENSKNTVFCVSIQSLINSGYYKGDENIVNEWKDEYAVYVEIDKNEIYNYEVINSDIDDRCRVINDNQILTNQRESYTFKENITNKDIGILDYFVTKVDDTTYSLESVFTGIPITTTVKEEDESYFTIILDKSGSMKNDWSSAKDAAITLSKTLSENLDKTQIAAIRFENEVTMIRDFGETPLDAKRDDWGNEDKNGDTNTPYALDTAYLLNKKITNTDAKKFVILLHDGLPNRSPYFTIKKSNYYSYSNSKNYFNKINNGKIPSFAKCNNNSGYENCIKSLRGSAKNLRNNANTTLIQIGYNYSATQNKKYSIYNISSTNNDLCGDSDYKDSNNQHYCYYEAAKENLNDIFQKMADILIKYVDKNGITKVKLTLTPPNDDITFVKKGVEVSKIVYEIDLQSSRTTTDIYNYEIRINSSFLEKNDIVDMFNAQITYFNDKGEEIPGDGIEDVPKLNLSYNKLIAIN